MFATTPLALRAAVVGQEAGSSGSTTNRRRGSSPPVSLGPAATAAAAATPRSGSSSTTSSAVPRSRRGRRESPSRAAAATTSSSGEGSNGRTPSSSTPASTAHQRGRHTAPTHTHTHAHTSSSNGSSATSRPAAPSGVRERGPNILQATLRALGFMGAAALPSQRYRAAALINRRVYETDPAPLSYTERPHGGSSAHRRGRGRPAADAAAVEDGEPSAGGLSTDAQHSVLRRLQYQRPTAVDDLAVGTGYTPCTPLSSSATTTTSMFPGDGANRPVAVPQYTAAELQWIGSLLPAASPAVPYPEASTHCQVCLRRFRSGEDVAEMPCGHLFHFFCIVRWLKTRAACPFCRQTVSAADGDDCAGSGGGGPRRSTRSNSAPPPDV